MKSAIVTGATGFIGKAVCKELSNRGVMVTAVVHGSDADTSHIGNLPGVHVVCCAMEDYVSLPEILSGETVDVMYHFAWSGSSGPGREKPDVQLHNVQYTCDLVRACAQIGCKRFVFASSVMIYEIMAQIEQGLCPGINTLYCSAKLAADYMAYTVAASEKVDYVRAIISNVYGPGETSPRLISSSLRKMLKGEHCAFSPGEQMYDFIYCDDAAAAFALIGEKGISNGTYYIGNAYPRPLKEFLLEMRDQVDQKLEIGLGELPDTGFSLTYKEFDTQALERDFGFVPQVTFAEGIRRTVQWIKSQKTGNAPRFVFTRLDFAGGGVPACVIDGFYTGDRRGGFTKSFEKRIYLANGVPFQVDETFFSVSEKNVIRGLHFQLHGPQAKLVSVPWGRAWDVIVDLRPDSPTFKRWRAIELSGENHRAVYVPRGFAHGFASLQDGTIMMYQCEGAYDKMSDTGIRFDEPAIGIEWPVDLEEAVHSKRDLELMSFEEYMREPMTEAAGG